ncbi:E3 ubiquitin-protein ligase [Collichthys lucidus]|uniref:E3 ubiquitin-protein ligase n=1 Tax=Collichthys lucidus TaxID=240159 RepID=A0A4U5VR85_COLLU|nr:E3 ubiquitin-protein ligase [Collichthys lucidus]
MSAARELEADGADDDKLVRPKVEFHTLLRLAGATKDVFTMKEVMFYLGQYIIQKQLYDQKQQHIVHCSQDALGRVLGVDSFSVKEPRVLFAMITKNLVAVKSPESPPSSSEALSDNQTERATEEESEEEEEEPQEQRPRPLPQHTERRRRGDGGGGGGRRRRQEEEEVRQPVPHLRWEPVLVCDWWTGEWAGQTQQPVIGLAQPASDSDSDNFSVEFEVESVASDDYNEDDASLSADDQVYEVTIFEAEDEDSFDEDTEITEAVSLHTHTHTHTHKHTHTHTWFKGLTVCVLSIISQDYWRCVKCDELNPPLPRNCLRCWTLHHDWLPEDITKSASSSPKALPPKPTDQSAAKEAPASDVEENDGVDVPDGKRSKTPVLSQCLSDSTLSAPDSTSSAPNSQDLLSGSQPSSSCSQQNIWTSDSQPSSSIDSQELLPPSPTDPPPPLPPAPAAAPELERSVSAEWRLPDSCLDPCLICQSRPKNGCIVHGRTGHLMSCYVCARKLKKRNKLCPVCRLPIQSVVLTYLS